MKLIKYVFTIIFSSVLISSIANAEINAGFTLTALGYDGSGSETMKSSGSVKKDTEKTGLAGLGSIFIEYVSENGTAVGIDVVPYSPTIGSAESVKSHSSAGRDSGTNKVDVNLSKVMMIYGEVPVSSLYLKVGYSRLTLETDETVFTGSSYGDEDTSAMLIGIGKKGEMKDGGFWKIEGAYQVINGMTFTGSKDSDGVSNKITVDDIDTFQLRISVGKTF